MVNYNSNQKLELDDNEVLFPNQEEYETDDKEMLIARLKDKDKLIEKLWLELKGTREQEELWKKHAGDLVKEHNSNMKYLQKLLKEKGIDSVY